MTKNKQAVFLHTMFRSGGTYVWNQFREDKYFTAYYEPFNELLADYSRAAYVAKYEGIQSQMHHKGVNREYFEEFPVDDNGQINNFKDSFAYASYILDEKEYLPDLQNYIKRLIDNAGGRPVFKFCRSMLRVPWLTAHFNPLNIAVLRNPTDQWQSFNTFSSGYFHAVNLMLTAYFGSDTRIPSPDETLYIPPFRGKGSKDAIPYYQTLARHMEGESLYGIFYYWWLLGTLVLVDQCEIVIDIDHARSNRALAVATQQHELPLTFSDCTPTPYDAYDLKPNEMKHIEAHIEYLIAKRWSNTLSSMFKGIEKKKYFLGPQISTRVQSVLEKTQEHKKQNATMEIPHTHPLATLQQNLKPFAVANEKMILELFSQLNSVRQYASSLETDRDRCEKYALSLERKMDQLTRRPIQKTIQWFNKLSKKT